MQNELVIQNESQDLIVFDDEKIDLIKRTVAKGATNDELDLFMYQCQRVGLDPLAKQIYFQKYSTKNGPQIAIITGIDGYRLIASRTGKYAGNDEPVFDGRMNFGGRDVPIKATVTVWRVVGGVRCPFSASVYWDEYCPLPPKDYQWKKMPHVMLAKCAEAAALRKAFPADLSGVYTDEEMQQASIGSIPSLPINSRIEVSEDGEIVDDNTTQPEATYEAVDASDMPEFDETVTDLDTIRLDLAKYPRMTFVQAANAAVETGLYTSKEHAENALKQNDSFKQSGGKLSAGIDGKVGLEIFDWLMARKADEQPAPGRKAGRGV